MDRNRWSQLWFLAAFSLIFCVTHGASAAPIVYGNFSGDTVDYLGVQEESSTDPGLGLFGPPTVTDDTMDFNPQGFAASSTGLDSDTTDSNLQFTVMAHKDKSIKVINFSEAGDTTLSGLAGEAQTTVGNIITPEITELNIAGVLTPVSISLPQVVMGFNPKNDFKLSVDGAGSKGWTGQSSLDLTPYGAVTKVFISLDNALTAASVAGTSAFIQKKDADALIITVTTGEIPEPATLGVVMIGIALGSVVGRRRR